MSDQYTNYFDQNRAHTLINYKHCVENPFGYDGYNDFSWGITASANYNLNDNLWGEYGFYDAFSVHYNWYSDKYIAIDQGPILLMIENYRTQLLWNLFMQDQDIINGLEGLGFNF